MLSQMSLLIKNVSGNKNMKGDSILYTTALRLNTPSLGVLFAFPLSIFVLF